MTKGTRLAIVAGILVAIAAGATVAVASLQTTPEPPVDNANNTNSEPREFVVELKESLSVEAK